MSSDGGILRPSSGGKQPAAIAEGGTSGEFMYILQNVCFKMWHEFLLVTVSSFVTMFFVLSSVRYNT